jgi:hypothetical protein
MNDLYDEDLVAIVSEAEMAVFARELIAQRAFALFLKRGGSHGSHVEDWLQAEREYQT